MNLLLALALIGGAAHAEDFVMTPFRAVTAQAADSGRATAARAPAKVAQDPIDRLAAQLIREGDQLEREDGVLHALGRDEKLGPNSGRRIEAGVLEVEGDPAAGRIGDEDSNYYDLLERHTYARLEASETVTTVAADGKSATVETHVYIVGLGGSLRQVQRIVISGFLDKAGKLTPDPKKSKSEALSPASAAPRWEKLVPELLKLHKTLEA